IGIVPEDRVRICPFGARDQRLSLPRVVVGTKDQISLVAPAAVANCDRLQRVSEIVDGQHYAVRHSGIGKLLAAYLVGFALVVEVDRFARVGEEDSMYVWTEVLKTLNGVIALRKRVGTDGGIGTVEGVDLLPEYRALE